MSAHTDRTVARQAFRNVRRGAVAWGVAFGLTAAASATTYATSFPTAASRAQLAATTGSDAGLNVLLGPASEIASVGGYTVYKGFVFLTTIAAIWAVLATTKALRGEEESGRWQLVLAGGTRAGRATGATVAALLAAVGVIAVATAVIVAAAGRDPDVAISVAGASRYSLSLAVVAVTFIGVGALASQLAGSRRGANAVGAGAFTVALLVRMVADADAHLHWLRWLTPFGWSERMRPLTEASLLPLVPTVLVTAALVGASLVLASRRDVGEGVLARTRAGAFSPRGLGTSLGFSLRRERGVLAGWVAGAAAAGLFLGVLSELTTEAIPDSMQTTLDKLGVNGSFTLQFFGVSFLLVATVLALLPASQIGAVADEELSGRLRTLLALSVARDTWLAGRLLITAGAIGVAAALAGVGAWLGAAVRGVDVPLGSLVAAALNTVPAALLVLGFGALLFVFVPRQAATATYAIVIWSLLVDVVAPLITRLGWLAQLSIFHRMPLAPAEPLDAAATLVTLALAGGAAALACVTLRHRDLRTA